MKPIQILMLALMLFLAACAEVPAEEVDGKDVNPLSDRCDAKFFKLRLCTQVEWVNLNQNQVTSGFMLKMMNLDKANQMMNPAEDFSLTVIMPNGAIDPRPAKIEKISYGIYQISELNVGTKGAWEFRMAFRQGNTLVDEAVYILRIQ